MNEKKRLYKSSSDKAIFGVCGGIGDYFDVDSLVIRLIFVLISLIYGSGLLIYLIFAIIMPKESAVKEAQTFYSAQNAAAPGAGSAPSGEGFYRAAVNPDIAAQEAQTVYAASASYEAPAETVPADDSVSSSVAAATAAMQELTRQLNEDTSAPEASAEQTAAESAAAFEDAPETVVSGTCTAGASQDRYDKFRAFEGTPAHAPANEYHDQTQVVKKSSNGGGGIKGRYAAGLALVVLGVIAILKVLIPAINLKIVWGVIAIALGFYLILSKK